MPFRLPTLRAPARLWTLSTAFSGQQFTRLQTRPLLCSRLLSGPAASEYEQYKNLPPVGIVVAQGFTETTPQQRATVQKVYDVIRDSAKEHKIPLSLPPVAEDQTTFKANFSLYSGLEFSPDVFWRYRSERLASSLVVFVVRLSDQFSESRAVEMGYTVALKMAGGQQDPWKHIHILMGPEAKLQTTMLKNANLFDFDIKDIPALRSYVDKVIDKVAAQFRI